jgi:hypothetical protein
MASPSEYTRYFIGYTALSGLYIVPLTVLWFITFCLARKLHDPARVGIVWLKTVFPVWLSGLALALARACVHLYIQFNDAATYAQSFRVQLVIGQLSTTASFLFYLADIFLFITFVELAAGYTVCLRNPAETTRTRKFGRIGIFAWSGVLFVLILSLFALRHSFYARITSWADFGSWSDIDFHVTSLRLEGGVKILLWLTSIPMVGLGSFTVHKAKNHPLFRSGSVLFLVATILDFVRHTITMAIFAQGYLSNAPRAVTIGPAIEPAVDWIVESFFNFTLMFVLLVILFALAIRTHKGLWSQPQPEWGHQTVVYGPPMPYPPGQVPVGMVPAQPQYVQQQPMQGMPAYLQVAQQQQQQQGQQGHYYYPQPGQQQQQPQQMQQMQQQQQPQQMQQMQQQQQSDEPQPVPQQQTRDQPKTTEDV